MPALDEVGDRLWLAEGGIVSFYGFPYPTRALIARLDDGGLWVWSPVCLSPAMRAAVDGLGEVAHLVSPNKLHHLYMRAWHDAYPRAALWGPASMQKRHPELAFRPPLENVPPAEWGGAIDQAWFDGSILMDEIVFFHAPSRTAIFADLIQAFDEEFLRAHHAWWQRPLAALDGLTASRPGAPREWRLSFLHRARARAARDKVLSWKCERVVMAHGAYQRSGGAAYVERALGWIGR
jgi:hypothetical protein